MAESSQSGAVQSVEQYPPDMIQPTPAVTMATKQKVCRDDQDMSTEGPFSHPVYKQVSLANGIINKMTKDDIRRKLSDFRLDTRGHKDVLKKRLKNYLKNRKLVQAKVRKRTEPLYDYYIVIDFEATCDEYNPEGFKHEIIEFPVILIDAKTITAVDEFHAYVRPVINSRLTAFCTKLTGITQEQVNAAETFDCVLNKMVAWMKTHHLGSGKTFALITDGPWDMSRFMFLQCQWSQILLPRWAKKWINLRKSFCNFYRLRRAKLITMLENLGMSFEGHQHSGLDDTRNISRIVMRMLADGAELRLNEELFRDKRIKNQAIVCPLKKVDFTNSDSEEEYGGGEIHGEDATSVNNVNADCVTSTHNSHRHSTTSHTNLCSSEGSHTNHTDHRNADSLTEGIRKLHVETTVVEEPENYDDLLSYYALQKS